MLTLIRFIRESFGDPDIPKDGSAFKILTVDSQRDPNDVLKTYEEYLSTGGTPIDALESLVKQREERSSSSP